MRPTVSADVLIVGMGPAGATCARLLASLGLEVIGIEREEFPRRKPCGGCVTGRALSFLGGEARGALERSYTRAVLVGKNGEEISLASGKPIAYGVKRETFDHLLLESAKRAGARVRSPERAMRFAVDGGEVRLETDRGRYRARYLVGADGAGGSYRGASGAGGNT